MDEYWDNFVLCEVGNLTPDNEYDEWEDDYKALLASSVKKPAYNNKIYKNNTLKDPTGLVDASYAGDLNKIVHIMTLENWNVDAPINDSYTLLHIACERVHYEIVKYLLIVCCANANINVNNKTPLMAACSSLHKNEDDIIKVCQLLVDHGAIITTVNSNEMTAFKLACERKYKYVARWLISKSTTGDCNIAEYKSMLNAINNQKSKTKKSSLVLNDIQNCDEIITESSDDEKFLNVEKSNLLPQDFCHNIPSSYLVYNKLIDYMPRIFPINKCPGYFQDVCSFLTAMSLGNYMENFVKANISLEKFLHLDEEDLKKIGVKYDCQRQLFQKCLIDFYLHHWTYKGMGYLDQNGYNFGSFLIMIGNHTQSLTVMKATLCYIKQNINNNLFGPVSLIEVITFQKYLKDYRATLINVRELCKQMISFRPKNYPLHIDYKKFCTEKKQKKSKRYFTYITIFIGVSIFVSIKLKRLLCN